jgi:hypothetical protein
VASCEERQNSDVPAGRIKMTEARRGGVKEDTDEGNRI